MMLPRAGPRWLCMSIRMSSRPSSPGDGCRKTRRPSVRAGHAGIGGSALPARIGRACLCRRDFTGHRLGTAGPIAACAPHKIDVDMIVVSGVVAGREHGRKVIAGRKMDVAQEALLFRRPMPSVLYGNPTAVRQGESGDVERVAECVFGNTGTSGANHAATRIGGDLLDLRHGFTEPAHCCRLHAIADPSIEGRDDRTRQRRGWRKRCRYDCRDWRPACGTKRRQAALRRLINWRLIRALLRLIGWRLVGALWRLVRRSAVGTRCISCRRTIARQLGIVWNIVWQWKRILRQTERRGGCGTRPAEGNRLPGGRGISVIFRRWRSRHPTHPRRLRGLNGRDRRWRRVLRLIDRPARHLPRAIRNRSGRPRIVSIADERTAFTQCCDLEWEIGAAHTGAFDRIDLHDARVDFNGARFHAGDLGVVTPGRTFA